MSVVVVAFARFVAAGRRRGEGASEPRLPQGAEAALWSILEAVPDPRNHLAMTRDLSGEVRITDLDRAMAAAPAPAAATAAVEPTEPTVEEPVAASTPSTGPHDEVVDVREVVDRYYDLGAIAENAPLTDHLFTGVDS